MIKVNAFVDGSYKHGRSCWGFIIIDENNNLIHKDKGFIRGKINKMHQVASEITSVLKAVEYCIINGYNVNINFDYNGLVMWIADIYLNDEKPWKPKNIWTQNYRDFMIENKHVVNSMIKIRAHSNNRWNDYVDNLCKM